MPDALDVADVERPGKHMGEREKREPEEEGETDNGPWVHLSARGSTVLSGTTSVF